MSNRVRKASAFADAPVADESVPDEPRADLSTVEDHALSAYEARASGTTARAPRIPAALRRGLEEKRKAREAVKSHESKHVKRVTLALPNALHARLKDIADSMNLPLREVLMQAMELYGTDEAS